MTPAIVLPEGGSQGARRRLSRWTLFWSAASVALSAAVYLWIYVTGQEFEILFRGFGDDLPWLTKTVLATYRFYGFLIVVGLIPCALLLKDRKGFVDEKLGLIKLIVIGLSLAFIMLAVAATAVYLPVLQIESSM